MRKKNGVLISNNEDLCNQGNDFRYYGLLLYIEEIIYLFFLKKRKDGIFLYSIISFNNLESFFDNLYKSINNH